MIWKSYLFLLVICGYQSQARNQLKISIYYESLCPDCRAFLREQLPSVYRDMSEYLNLDFVPAGFATVKSDSKTLEFDCQHGPKECYGNKAHSCALALLPKEKIPKFILCSIAKDPSSDDDLKQVKSDSKTLEFDCQHGPKECYGNKAHSCALALLPKEKIPKFILCSIAKDPSSDDDLKQCSEENGLSWSSLYECANSERGNQLLLMNVLRTINAKPRIVEITCLFFNNVFNKTLQDAATENLKPVVCDILQNEPAACRY